MQGSPSLTLQLSFAEMVASNHCNAQIRWFGFIASVCDTKGQIRVQIPTRSPQPEAVSAKYKLTSLPI